MLVGQPENHGVVSFGYRIHTCVDMGTASCGREDLCLICALSLHKREWFFMGYMVESDPRCFDHTF